MKKWWQNINRGILLLIVVLLGLSVYLLVDAANTRKEKKVVRELSSEYARESSCLYQFPSGSDFWSWNGLDSDEILPALLSQAEPLNRFFCDNEAVRKNEISKCWTFFRESFFMQMCPLSVTKTPVEIKISEIYNGSASVSVYSRTTIEYTDKNGKQTMNEIDTTDSLVFHHIDGEWKLVKADSTRNEFSDY